MINLGGWFTLLSAVCHAPLNFTLQITPIHYMYSNMLYIRDPSLQSTLHKRKWRILTSVCITHVLANKQFIPHISTFITIMLLALTTTCDGGALLTTQGTHICLILHLILRGGRVAFINPNMRQGMVPWSIRRHGPASECKIA